MIEEQAVEKNGERVGGKGLERDWGHISRQGLRHKLRSVQQM
jgi:hypothetical protein